MYVVLLHIASLHGNCTLHIYHFQALDSVQSALEACVVSFTAVCLGLAFIRMLGKLCLRNRKHVPCFYRVIETLVEVLENEKCCGNTSRRRVFLLLDRNTEYMICISFRKHRDEKKENLLTLIIKM